MLSDSSGKGVKVRTAVAKELVLGAMTFRDVSFAVVPHEEEVGALRMPILLAGRTLRWLKDGSVEFGGTIEPPLGTSPNLVFDRHRLLLRTQILTREVLTTFDTGATTTDLNTNFTALFSEMIQAAGTKTTQDIEGFGGKQTFDAITLPEVVFTIGGSKVGLRPAQVTLQRIVGMGGECCIGNAGRDLLTQGQGFTIDFSTMTLHVH